MRVIIVGGGIAGLSTAWALQKSGVQVTLLEQGPLPNPLASSVDDHRLIRYPYGTPSRRCPRNPRQKVRPLRRAIWGDA